MKKKHPADDELRPEYDLPGLLKGAERGKYAGRYAAGRNVVLLDPDVASAFPDSDSVNAALRLLLEAASHARRAGVLPTD